jgi:hypothetical protein
MTIDHLLDLLNLTEVKLNIDEETQLQAPSGLRHTTIDVRVLVTPLDHRHRALIVFRGKAASEAVTVKFSPTAKILPISCLRRGRHVNR